MITSTVIWFVLCVICIGVEMMIGTLYLLAVALGAFCAGIVSYLGFSLTTQFMTAGIITIAGAACFYFIKRRRAVPDRDDSLDIGQMVSVREINDDGSATVTYRGAQWKAFASEGKLSPGTYTIERVNGTQLILRK